MTNSYDILARYYDVDMGINNPGDDIAFFVAEGRKAGGHILELGCGTGRITIPVAQSGCRITGIDRSAPMLAELARKAEALPPEGRARLDWRHMDMAELRLPGPYAAIFCPFAAFTYLITDDARACCLHSVQELLRPGGRFIVDCFVPRPEIESLPDSHVFHDYTRPIAGGRILTRTKTIEKNPAARLNTIRRHYRVTGANGEAVEEFSTEATIRYYSAAEMTSLLAAHGFRVDVIYGGYRYESYSPAAQMAVFISSPED